MKWQPKIPTRWTPADGWIRERWPDGTLLAEPYETLASQLIETIREGGAGSGDQLDLRYAVRAVLRKFDVKLRPVPLDADDITKPPPVCPVCQKPTGSSVAELRLSDGEHVHAHPECVNWPKRKP